MTKDEFKAAFELAHNDGIPWNTIDDSIVHGCALPDFKPVHVTLLIVARFIRWQCLYMGHKPGESPWDMNEVNQCAAIARKRFTLVEDFKTAIERAALVGGSHGNNRD